MRCEPNYGNAREPRNVSHVSFFPSHREREKGSSEKESFIVLIGAACAARCWWERNDVSIWRHMLTRTAASGSWHLTRLRDAHVIPRTCGRARLVYRLVYCLRERPWTVSDEGVDAILSFSLVSHCQLREACADKMHEQEEFPPVPLLPFVFPSIGRIGFITAGVPGSTCGYDQIRWFAALHEFIVHHCSFIPHSRWHRHRHRRGGPSGLRVVPRFICLQATIHALFSGSASGERYCTVGT